MSFFNNIDTSTYVSREHHVSKSSPTTQVQTKPTIFPRINSNGKIDLAFIQGGKNDCYLLTSLLALYQTTEGKQYIKDNLQENPDGSITVTLPGIKAINKELKKSHKPERIPESFTITPEEIQNAHNYSYAHRPGGKNNEWEDDVILYELAFEKYRKHIMENQMFQYDSNYVGGNIGYATEANPLNYGKINDAMFLLTGKMATEYIVSRKNTDNYSDYENDDIELQKENATKKHLNKILDRFMNNPKRYALCAATTDHALQIVKVTENEVIIRDPQKGKNNEPISREEFLNSIYSITVWDSKKNTVSGFLENIAGL